MKKLIYKNSFFLLLVLSYLLMGCQAEDSLNVNQDKIYTEYELFYDANEDKTYAKAKFKFGNGTGTDLKLNDKSKIFFNNDILTYDQTFAYYQKAYPGFISSGTFRWEDTDGKKFSNDISVKPIAFSPISKISRNSSFELVWQGDSLTANESVYIIANGKNGGVPQLASTNELYTKRIILAKNQLEQINPGSVELIMDRAFQPGMTNKTSAGGVITGKYRAKNVTIPIE